MTDGAAIGPATLQHAFDHARRALETGDPATARAEVDTLLALGANDAGAINLAAILLFRTDDRARAIAVLREAAARLPGEASIAGNLANALHETGAHGEALEWHEKAIARAPDNAGYRLNCGLTLQAMHLRDRAEQAFRDALARDPRNVGARRSLAGNLAEAGHLDEACALFEGLLAERPDDALAIRIATMLPPILPSLEVIPEIRNRFADNVTALVHRKLRIASPTEVGSAPFFLAYHGENEIATKRRLATLYLDACPTLPFVAPHCADPAHRQPDGRLRIGFLSPNLRTHTIGRLFGGLIGGLDPARFETMLFRRPQSADALSQAIDRSVARVVPISTDLAAAQRQIAACELDAMFYPDIGMDMATYAMAFARLAPVQCVSWGHPLTTGIPTLDYFLSWDAAEPADASAHYSERLIRLRSLPVCYRRPKFEPDRMRRARFGLPDDKRLYLCLQTLFKLHPSFDAALGAILRGDPDGLVVLIEGARQNWKMQILERLRRTIPDVVDRVRFVPPQTNEDYLALTALGDVVLDPPVFGGGNTTLEALAAGRPVITLPGRYLRGRLTQAFLLRCGRESDIADDISDYAERALAAGRAPATRPDPAINAVLFDDRSTLREHEAFFVAAREAARRGQHLAKWPL